MPSYLGETVSQEFLDYLVVTYKGGYIAMHPAHEPPLESDSALLALMETALVRGRSDADALARRPFYPPEYGYRASVPSSSYANLIVADDAAAYFPLQETTGTTAVNLVSEAGVAGTISGGVTLGVPGPLGGDRAMRFDGVNDYVAIPKGTYSDFGTGPLTFEWWVRMTAAQTVNARVLCCLNASGGVELTQDATGGLNVNYRDATTVQGHTASNAILPDGQWRHLAMVITRGAPDTARFYVNGALFGTVKNITTSGVNFTAAPLLALAANTTGGAGSCFNGELAHVALYKTALTAAQVQAHYDAKGSSPLAYQQLVMADGASLYCGLQELSGTSAATRVPGPAGTYHASNVLAVPGPMPGTTAVRFANDGVSARSIVIPNGAYSAFGTGPLTLECWIRQTAPQANTTLFIECKNWTGTNGGAYLRASTNTDGVAAVQQAAGTVRTVTATGGLPADGRWRHVAGVLERTPSTTLKIYVDGVLKNSTAVTAGENYTSADILRIGEFFSGDLAMVAIYKVALTPAQILAHYNARIPRTVY